MAKYLTDPAIEDEIQALAAEAPLPTVIKLPASPGSTTPAPTRTN